MLDGEKVAVPPHSLTHPLVALLLVYQYLSPLPRDLPASRGIHTPCHGQSCIPPKKPASASARETVSPNRGRGLLSLRQSNKNACANSLTVSSALVAAARERSMQLIPPLSIWRSPFLANSDRERLPRSYRIHETNGCSPCCNDAQISPRFQLLH